LLLVAANNSYYKAVGNLITVAATCISVDAHGEGRLHFAAKYSSKETV
jgi:hypothetical protein